MKTDQELAQALECPVAQPVPVADEKCEACNGTGQFRGIFSSDPNWPPCPVCSRLLRMPSDSDWCMRKAALEDGHEIGAGGPAATPQPASAGPVVALEAWRDAYPESDEDNSIDNLWARYGSEFAYAMRLTREALASSPTPVGVSEAILEQALHDPENQPSQWGTIPAPVRQYAVTAIFNVLSDWFVRMPRAPNNGELLRLSENALEAALHSQPPAPKEPAPGVTEP